MTKTSSHVENIVTILKAEGVRYRVLHGLVYVDSRAFYFDWLDITDWSIDRIVERLGY